MLKWIAIIAFVLAAAAAAVLAYAATLSDTFQIERAASIQAPPEKIFPLINDLRRFNTWNPFLKKDSAARLVYRGAESGKGAAHEWDGDRNVGKGRLEITAASPPSEVTMKLDMIAPIEAHNVVKFALQPEGPGTRVTWAMSGERPFVGKVLSVFCSMDEMVGSEFEKGLASLKTIAEN